MHNSGGIAGACAKTVIAPFERIKLLFVVRYSIIPKRLCVSQSLLECIDSYSLKIQTRDRTFNYSEAFKEAKYIVKSHGVKNLWRGNSANLLRIFPFASIVKEDFILGNS